MVVTLAACGPSAADPGDGDGGGDVSTDRGDDDGPGGSGVGEEGAVSDGGTDSGSLQTTGSASTEDGTGPDTELPPCGLAIRLDECCNQPQPTTADEIERDECLVPWPLDTEALPDGVLVACAEQQPEFCGIVDCTYAPAASDVVEFDDEGECVYICPQDLYLSYQQPGCGTPPAVVECLPVPPPCATEFCSCDGETVFGCGWVSEPFQFEGACR